MTIGFIGAGKVGTSLGRYLTERGAAVTGYYSRSMQSAEEAAEFTSTRVYSSVKDLAGDSDAVFLTVPDDEIIHVWNQLKTLPIENKMICHFSGVLSSEIFSDIGQCRAHGFSIHPLFAFSNRFRSCEELSHAVFTIEGDHNYREQIAGLFERLGNRTTVIEAENKIRYHAAAAMASNLYVGLVALCEDMLKDCGFSAENAHAALAPLIEGNARHIIEEGVCKALTGPVERNDVQTVQAHLNALEGNSRDIYRLLSEEIVKIAEKRHSDRDYSQLEGILKQ